MAPEAAPAGLTRRHQAPLDVEATHNGQVLVTDHRAAVVTFKNLKITAVTAKKTLIDKVNGVVDKGLWAVMGASGSGVLGEKG